MTYPRSLSFDAGAPGAYHCITRCVRRAWLCGRDRLTGHSYAHRRRWIASRVQELAASYAVTAYAWATMSNHYHLVLYVDPLEPQRWTDREVARRWFDVRHPAAARPLAHDVRQARIEALLADPSALAAVRTRLGNLSWFIRNLNEDIARRANAEDGCTGRFWEGRYYCQHLLDEHALLAAMTYVDLNPLRAKVTRRLANAHQSTIVDRIQQLRGARGRRTRPLEPLAGTLAHEPTRCTLARYLELVKLVAQRRDARSAGGDRAKPRPGRRSDMPDIDSWIDMVQQVESRYSTAIGEPEALREKARATQRKWVRGQSRRR